MGPIASVLFQNKQHHANEIAVYLKKNASIKHQSVGSWDVQIDKKSKRPFLFEITDIQQDVIDILLNSAVLGMDSSLHISAMCNAAEDHHLLADLCIHFAEKLDGLIYLNGAITPPTNKVKNPLRKYPYMAIEEAIEYANSIKGNNLIDRYETAFGEWFVQIVDVEYLKNWQKNENFSMIK